MFVSRILSVLSLKNLKFKPIRVKTKKKRKKISYFFKKHTKWVKRLYKGIRIKLRKWNLLKYDLGHSMFNYIKKRKKRKLRKNKFFIKLFKKNKFINKKYKRHYKLYYKFLNKFKINKKSLTQKFKRTKYYGKVLYFYLLKKLNKKIKKIKKKRFKWRRYKGRRYKKTKKNKFVIQRIYNFLKNDVNLPKFSYQYNFLKKKKLQNYSFFLNKIVYKVKNYQKNTKFKIIYKTRYFSNVFYYIRFHKYLNIKNYKPEIRKVLRNKKKVYILKFTNLPKIKFKKILNNKFFKKIIKIEKKIKNVKNKHRKIFKIKKKIYKTRIKKRKKLIKYFFFKRKLKILRKRRRKNRKYSRPKRGFMKKNFKIIKHYNKNAHFFLKNIKKFLFLKRLYWFKNRVKSVDITSCYINQINRKIKLIKKASVLRLRRKKRIIISIHKKFRKYSKHRRKIYKYIRVRKLTKYRSYANYININQTKNYYVNRRKTSIIFNCMYLNKYTASHYFLNFFRITKLQKYYKKSFLKKKIIKYSSYTTHKHKYIYHKKHIKKHRIWQNYRLNRHKTYFFNSWRGLLVTWKNARLYHWKIYKKGTIKKRRYRVFLPPFLQKTKIKLDLIINYFSFKFKFSNLFWKEFSKLYLYFFDKKLTKKEIFQIPINLIFWIFLNKLRRKKRRIKKKIKSWLYRNIRIKRTFWMELKRKTPKFFSYQLFNFNKTNSAIQYDFVTNYFCVIKNCISFEAINEYILNNKLLKMHNFRFKS